MSAPERESILGLVTLYHAERYLPDLYSMPHIVRTRQMVQEKVRDLAATKGLQTRPYYNHTPGVVTGREVVHLRQKLLDPGLLVPHLAEPRILFSPDVQRQAKWKVEFRKSWPHDEGRLPEATQARLRFGLRECGLQITGLWVNPTADLSKYSQQFWVNLNLAAIDSSTAGHRANVRFFPKDDTVWIAWQA